MAVALNSPTQPESHEYRRRVNAWVLYDWANSAFATTILAAVLPIYFSQVAGATLPSEAVATAYWSLALSLSLLIGAVLSPVLGTVSDITQAKKRFLTAFTAIGVIGTGFLVVIETGDWLLAIILFVIARVGFVGAYTFYDSLLPHVARPDDRDSVSARGYAFGYLGGGILLAVNAVMIFVLPGTWGPRLAFLSVAVWWAVFSIPILTRVLEPRAATERLGPGETVIAASIARLRATFGDIRRYRELFKYLIAFLIYNDAIGTIIGLAAIYGAELGFDSLELILALLLVQFVGMPFSLIFGRLPSRAEPRRPFFLAFIVFNLVMLPIVGVSTRYLLPDSFTGAAQPAYARGESSVSPGPYGVDHPAFTFEGDWESVSVSPALTGLAADTAYQVSDSPGAQVHFDFVGQEIDLTYSTGPAGGIWNVMMDGQLLLDDETGEPLRLDSYSPTERYGVTAAFVAPLPGEHRLTLTNTGDSNPSSAGAQISITQVELPAVRQSNLLAIVGLIVLLQGAGALFAILVGRRFAPLAAAFDTRRSILLALVIYGLIATWGFFVNSTVEFWFLAWMVAIVQGGSQALSRSLYASMSPASRSGEFFGLYGIMEKFSSIVGPLLFALAAALFGSSRPAILSLIAFFIIGGYLLTRVDVAEGQRIAQEEDARLADA